MKKPSYKRKKPRSTRRRASNLYTKKWLDAVSLPDANILADSGGDCGSCAACGFSDVYGGVQQACLDWCWAAVEVMLGWYDSQCEAFNAQYPGMGCCADDVPCCECGSGDCGVQAGDVGNDDDYMDGCPSLPDLEIGDCDLPICCFVDGGDPDVGHFVVLYGYQDCSNIDGGVTFYYMDPTDGDAHNMDYDDFCNSTYSSLC